MSWTRRTMLLAVTASVACGDEGTGNAAEWAGEIVDSAGIALVRNPEAGIWTEGERWSFEEEFRIGGMSASEEYQFGSVVGIAIDGDGNVWVADQQARELRVFAPDGSFLRTVGTPGEGPGELGLAMAGVFVHGDTVLVPDMSNIRLQRYTLAGDEAGSTPIDLTRGIPLRWDQLPDGRIVAQRRAAGEGMGGEGDLDPISTLGAESTTIVSIPRGMSFEMSGGAPRIRIFEPEPVWDVGEDGRLVWGMNADYRIRIHDLEGTPMRIVTRPFERRPVTEGDQRRLLDAIGRLMGDQGAPPAMVDAMLSQFTFAESYPAFAQVVLASDGTLWVQRIRTAAEFGETGEFDPQDLGSDRWDLFDAEGRYLGEVELPGRFLPASFRGDRIWGVQRDEFDVQSVVRLRVVRGGS